MAEVRTMTIEDYDGVMALLRRTPGVSIREADSCEATARYLARNPGLSFVAEAEGRVVGNEAATGYWSRAGWTERVDLRRFSIIRSGNPEA
jgi:predicted N-acetyltransferase YhbS